MAKNSTSFKKGQGGRPKGKKNTKTEQWDAFADYCLNGGLQKYQQELNSLKGEKFVIAFNNLLEFHKPKLARTQTEIDMGDNTLKIIKTIVHAGTKS